MAIFRISEVAETKLATDYQWRIFQQKIGNINYVSKNKNFVEISELGGRAHGGNFPQKIVNEHKNLALCKP